MVVQAEPDGCGVGVVVCVVVGGVGERGGATAGLSAFFGRYQVGE